LLEEVRTARAIGMEAGIEQAGTEQAGTEQVVRATAALTMNLYMHPFSS